MSDDFALALPQGTQVAQYRIVEVLGQGGFGITYRAEDTILGRQVALKEYLPRAIATRDADGSVVPQSTEEEHDFQWGLERFLQEARTLAQFQHPNIIRVHQVFTLLNTAFLEMVYESGETLEKHLAAYPGDPDESTIRSWLDPLLGALEEMHKADILHRDIKPENIILRADGSPVLLDFGAARQQLGSHSRSMSLVITPGYSPPEQYYGEAQGPWTDLYAVGATVYRAIRGHPPPDAYERLNKMRSSGDPYKPISKVKGYSPKLLTAVDRCLNLNEEERFHSIKALRAKLDENDDPHPPQPRFSLLQYVGSQIGAIGLAALIFVLGIASGYGDDPGGLVGVLIGLLLGGGAIVHLVLHYRLWKVLPPERARTTPGKAVGLQFVPLYNLYWAFHAYPGWARDFHAWVSGTQPEETPPAPYSIGVTAAILAVLMVLPLVNMVALPFYVICLLIFDTLAIKWVNHFVGETEWGEEWLQLTGKTAEGRPVELEVAIPDLQNEAEGLTIGRSSEYAEAVINDASVSRTHVRVHWLEDGQGQKGKVCLTDLGSMNGTSINGEPLTPGKPAGLDPGDRIQLGRVSLQAEQKRY